ncbi:hypothetical protein CALVIDRAFT_141746 [Calocera viscosa TUFC12733]|uniref:RRM domain-containing protein n=1 Tax=Calocera viscosa (strain TUFC12733) TaxID=1330018 RepID=A0A167LQ35_CALVF|nr:hypothetical protein CALVIDRAFT_141746 [Calocera viscosa TUFC12733]
MPDIDLQFIRQLAGFFGPIESLQECFNDRFRSANTGAKTWVIKWQFRNDCKAAFHVRRQLMFQDTRVIGIPQTLVHLDGINVVWTHLAGYVQYHAMKQAPAEQAFHMRQPPVMVLSEATKVGRNLTALELNEANFPSLSQPKSISSPSKTPSEPAIIPECPGELTGSDTTVESLAATTARPTSLFSPPENPKVQLPPVSKVDKAQAHIESAVAQSSPASAIDSETVVSSPSHQVSQERVEMVAIKAYKGALQLDTSTQVTLHESEPVDEPAQIDQLTGGAMAQGTVSAAALQNAFRGPEQAADLEQSAAPEHLPGQVDPYSIFVGNLQTGMDWSELRLKHIFGRYGNVESIKFFQTNCECTSTDFFSEVLTLRRQQ